MSAIEESEEHLKFINTIEYFLDKLEGMNPVQRRIAFNSLNKFSTDRGNDPIFTEEQVLSYLYGSLGDDE